MRRLWLVILVLTVWFVTFMMGYGYGYITTARADTKKECSSVYSTDSVTDAMRKNRRIAAQLQAGDEISVMLTSGEDHNLLGSYLTNQSPECVLLLVIGDQVWVRGNRWVPLAFLDEKLDRINNVTSNPIDQVVKLIDQIHTYQQDIPSPAPPPPPPPPSSVGDSAGDQGNLSDSAPTSSSWWNWAWGGPVIGVVILFILWLPLEMRRRKRVSAVSARADEQADWGLSDYNIKTTIE